MADKTRTKAARLSPSVFFKQLVYHPKQGNHSYVDYSLLAVMIVLSAFGLIMLYSTTAYTAQMAQGDDMYYFTKQAAIDIFFLLFAMGLSFLDYHMLKKVHWILYFLSLVLMFLVRTPLGIGSHGATRWIKLGPISFQPAESAKLAIIISVAFLLSRSKRKKLPLNPFLLSFFMGFFSFIIAWQVTDNMSTGIIIFAISFGIIFIAHSKTKPFVIMVVGFLALVFLFVFILQNNPPANIEDADFRTRRVLVWLHPEDYASNYGYQTLQSLYAIGSGGFWGRGLGNSIQKLGSIPEAQNDMIFAIVCEELGVFGALLMLALFGYLLYRLIFIAQNAPDLFGTLLVSGVFLHIALQVILNVSVVLNIIPNTGVTLPFISYGGTSILFLMTEMGIALSVSRQIRYQGSLYT